MKKTVAIILFVISMFCLLTASVSAEDTPLSRYNGYTSVYYSTDRYGNFEYEMNMVRNPYYQKYYNELLNYSCQVYKKLWKNTSNKNYIKSYSEQYLDLPENYCTLIFSAPEKEYDSIRDYNNSILVRYFDAENILYVSDYDYAAVVCIPETKAYVVNKIHELEFIGDAFFTNAPYLIMPMLGTYALGDVYFADDDYMYNDRITAADARFLLRYVAGLEEVGAIKQFYFCADMNFDNVINSADARLVLRTAAGLDPLSYVSYSYAQFWDDILGVINYEK